MRVSSLTLVTLSVLLMGSTGPPKTPLESSAELPAWRDRAQLKRDYPPHPESYWLERIAQVRLGMTRAQVETILPPYSENALMGATTIIGGGGITTEWYPVDQVWSVSLH